MKIGVSLVVFLSCCYVFAQQPSSNYRTKKFAFQDSIQIDTVSINSGYFKLLNGNSESIDSTKYTVDFAKALLVFKEPQTADSVIVEYLRYPDFITRKYAQLDKKIIVKNTSAQQQLYRLEQPTVHSQFTPFDGLTTSGSISRGVTVGNNQNSVLNSELDLQISGKLSDKVSLRASIQDANIPLQESGYSQRLNEFDQVFIELLSDSWRIRAGDIDLENQESYFASFNKRVQGLLLNATLNGEHTNTNIFAAGALARGQFTTSQFTAQEGNQGPYKLRGPNNELYVLVVSGSETVYVNGTPIKRGENQDYIIDYNAGEITFNATFPITSEMRITIDYQFSERNYSRFTAYGGGEVKSEKLKIGAFVYSEVDSKNQPLQQNLSPEQVQILSEAGDDPLKMLASSGVPESYSENRVLYKKAFENGVETFVYSANPEDELYTVKFRNVGKNQGDYVLVNSNAISPIYEYREPVSGVPQGQFAPVVKLIAPSKLQVAVVNASYKPSSRTDIYIEAAGSKNDQNLFSNLDDDDNDGFAGKMRLRQDLIKNDSLWNLSVILDADLVQNNFKTIERLYSSEFERNWNLENPVGDQSLWSAEMEVFNPKIGVASYKFEHLGYTDHFKGNRHNALVNFNLGNWNFFTNSNILKSNSDLATSTFLRSFNRVTYNFRRQWVGTKLAAEDNQKRDINLDELLPLSQRFKSAEVFYGIGDSMKVFIEMGYKYRVNDSLRNNRLERVNRSNTYYLKSKIIQNSNSDLGVFINYRRLKAEDKNLPVEQALNSRIYYYKKFLGNMLQSNTIYETNSGTLPQQDFTYIKVEPGQGAYTWNDYNGNGIQELNEFEIAQFQDKGEYIRVLLPNQIYLKTHQNRLSQTLTIDPQQWAVSTNTTQQFWSHFYNQTAYLIDRKLERENTGFDLNPFAESGKEPLGINKSFRNVFYFNRGKQHYSTSYTYLETKSKTLLSIGFQENRLLSHELNFNHKFSGNWLAHLKTNWDKNESRSQNFVSRNYLLDEKRIKPKISYLFDENARFDVFYQYATKDNTLGDLEALLQNNFGVSFTYNRAQALAITGEVNFFDNQFNGQANTPVSYQMLEGLQPGKNFTWTLLAQKKLTTFLDLNLNYFGRKTASSKTIHTGTIQLKAYF